MDGMSKEKGYRYSLVCPKCKKLCPLGSKRCSNCGALLLKKEKLFFKTFRESPKSFLQAKGVFIVFSSLALLLGVVGIIYGIKKYTSVIYTDQNYKKIEIIYLDKQKHPLETRYYVIRGDGKYSNYFNGKEKYWNNKPVIEQKVAFIDIKDKKLDLVKAYLKSPKGKLKLNSRTNKIEFMNKPKIILYSKSDKENFLDALMDHGECFYEGKSQIKYYKWNVISY